MPSLREVAMRRLTLWVPALLALAAAPCTAQARIADELDAYWATLVRTVVTGDLPGYRALYAADAVVVDQMAGETMPFARSLVDAERDWRRTSTGEQVVTLEFRFTQRLHDETTALETGIFRHSMRVAGGAPTVALIHFEALLIKRNGGWLHLMEYQKQPATEAEWEKAR